MMLFPWERKIISDIGKLQFSYSSLKAFSGADLLNR
jgi:hypothetical protein